MRVPRTGAKHRPLSGLRGTCAGAVALAAAALAGAPAAAQGQSPPPEHTRYIVVFKPGTTNVRQQAEAMANGAGSRPDFVYERVLQGFALTLPARSNTHHLDAMRRHPQVQWIEADQAVRHQDHDGFGAKSWGLDRVDQRDLPLDKHYAYTWSGLGVRIFVVDTGVLSKHAEFGSRVLPGHSVIGDGKGTEDCHGHGTHVAATAAGSVFGIAKSAWVVPVRVLDCSGSGTVSGVIAGINWVAGQADATRPAVANLSLGGGASAALDKAVADLVDISGISVAVAAGNSNADACNTSPARVPSALTVGATTSSDARASYSNWGKCLDLFAPGSSITSAGISSETATTTMSGTSMAAPHVAGQVALLLQNNSALSPGKVEQLVKSSATANKVSRPGRGSPNLLLYTGTGTP